MFRTWTLTKGKYWTISGKVFWNPNRILAVLTEKNKWKLEIVSGGSRSVIVGELARDWSAIRHDAFPEKKRKGKLLSTVKISHFLKETKRIHEDTEKEISQRSSVISFHSMAHLNQKFERIFLLYLNPQFSILKVKLRIDLINLFIDKQL